VFSLSLSCSLALFCSLSLSLTVCLARSLVGGTLFARHRSQSRSVRFTQRLPVNSLELNCYCHRSDHIGQTGMVGFKTISVSSQAAHFMKRISDVGHIEPTRIYQSRLCVCPIDEASLQTPTIFESFWTPFAWVIHGSNCRATLPDPCIDTINLSLSNTVILAFSRFATPAVDFQNFQ
jgi:hypothetical protein